MVLNILLVTKKVKLLNRYVLSYLKWFGYIKFFEDIWDRVKEALNKKFHSMPVYDEKYIKAKGI